MEVNRGSRSWSNRSKRKLIYCHYLMYFLTQRQSYRKIKIETMNEKQFFLINKIINYP